MGDWGTRRYARLMRVRPRLQALKRPVVFLLPLVLIASTGCLVQPQGLATAPTPGADGASRLPQLLQQLQAGGSALELFDASPTATTSTGTPGIQAQVLGVQDSATKTPGPAGTFGGGTQASTPTPATTPHPGTPAPKPATPTPARATGATSIVGP